MSRIETRAVLPPGSWREPDPYVGLGRYGPRGVAWELLRRDPAYPGTDIPAVPDGHPLPAADRAFVARWGLHFRGIA